MLGREVEERSRSVSNGVAVRYTAMFAAIGHYIHTLDLILHLQSTSGVQENLIQNHLQEAQILFQTGLFSRYQLPWHCNPISLKQSIYDITLEDIQ